MSDQVFQATGWTPGAPAEASGLDGVVVAATRLSHVDGAAGRLLIAGRDVEAVAAAGVEAAAALLWRDLAPEAAGGPASVRRVLGEARGRVFERVAAGLAASAGLDPVAGLSAMLSLAAGGVDGPAHVTALAAVPVIVAAALRSRRGLPPLPPDPDLGQAADFLRMLSGTTPDPAAVRALDAYLVTVADHGLNASTFAVRVVASTGAGLLPSVIAGLAALSGPLHGGAPGPVLDMLDAIGTPDRAAPWLAAALDRGDRLMGFGHRIYRTRDPRADVLKAALAGLGRRPARLPLAEAVEREALRFLAARKPDRVLATNVEFYTALLLDALGFPRDAFTAVFAAGRMAGWTAHVLEQRAAGRLIRPQSRYVGPLPVVDAAAAAG